MSRHILVDRPSIQVVLGFDHMLRSFFGQIFKPPGSGIARGGWPTRSGLGTRRPVRTEEHASEDLRLLLAWARGTQPEEVWEHPEAADHLDALRRSLRFEWSEGYDEAERLVPHALRVGV